MSTTGASSGRRASSPADHFGIKATLQVFTPKMTNAPAVEASPSSGGWFRKRPAVAPTGLVTESFTVTDFIKRTEGLFREAGLKHVTAIWVGSDPLYRTKASMPDQNNRDEADNLDEAFAAVSNSKTLTEGGGNAEDAGLRAHGFGQDFEAEFTATFKRTHPAITPSITLEILALPIDLAWRSGEGAKERADRLNKFVNDKAAVTSKAEEAAETVRDFVRSAQDMLRKAYDARDVTFTFQVRLEHIV